MSRSTLVVVQFCLLALTWGASFLFIKVGLEGLSPPQLVLGRLVSGAIVLVALSAVTRVRLPGPGVIWAHLTVVAVLLCVAPFLLFAWAEEHISSGLASIYNATTPLMTMLVALIALPEERPNRTRIAGLLAGFGGVMVVLSPWRGLGTGGAGSAQLALLLATACYGASFVYLRRFVAPKRLPAVSVASGQVGIAAVIMLLLTPVFPMHTPVVNGRVAGSVLVLGAAGTGLAYLMNVNVVNAWGATNASTVTYLTPLVGVALGVIVLSERVSWNQPVGALLVIAGIAVSQDRFSRNRSARSGHPHPAAAVSAPSEEAPTPPPSTFRPRHRTARDVRGLANRSPRG